MTPLPPGFRIVLDRSVRSHRDGRVLIGGNPGRVMRLTDAGRDAVCALRDGRDCSESARRLGRRLVDAGIAHPRPARKAGAERASQGLAGEVAMATGERPPSGLAGANVTVVVPVRDRPAELDRCLAAIGADAPVVVVDDGSADAAAIARICHRHGARLVARPESGGPAAARNTALPHVRTEVVAFLDSDCVPAAGWFDDLAAHFADPLVGAVAPRIRPLAPASGRPAPVRRRYATARSPLDMGPDECEVGPGRAVPYLPTAALLVRRAALETSFDAGLRYGEDVDLVWRLRDAGWRVRYDPAVVVHHDEPDSWSVLLERRFRYGTSAAPLARRHPGKLAPVVLRPWPAAAVAMALARRPVPALGAVAAAGLLLSRRLRGTGAPVTLGPLWSAQGAAHTMVGLGRAATMLAAPVLVTAATRNSAARAPALGLLAASPLLEWARRRPALDPLRWTLASIADDAAYGAGVWWGCLRERTVAPLTPVTRSPSAAPTGGR